MAAYRSMDNVPTKPRGHSDLAAGETTPRVAGWLRSNRGRVIGSTYTRGIELGWQPFTG